MRSSGPDPSEEVAWSTREEDPALRPRALGRVLHGQSGQGGQHRSLAVVLAMAGFLTVVQWRGTVTAERSLETRTPAELAIIIGEIEAENSEMRAEAARLEKRVTSADQAGRNRSETLNQAASELGNLRVMAGLAAAHGPGVRVTIRDDNGLLVPQDFVDTSHELRSAGAEAMAVDGIRLGPRSGFSGRKGEIALDGIALTSEYVIEAIGDPGTLAQALTMPGGLGSELAAFEGVALEVLEVDDVRLPGASRGVSDPGTDVKGG